MIRTHKHNGNLTELLLQPLLAVAEDTIDTVFDNTEHLQSALS